MLGLCRGQRERNCLVAADVVSNAASVGQLPKRRVESANRLDRLTAAVNRHIVLRERSNGLAVLRFRFLRNQSDFLGAVRPHDVR